MKVLILEDEVKLATEIQNFLEFRDMKCYIAFDGITCLKFIENFEFDIILLDINVPGMNGVDVCKRIRNKNAIVPIIMLTAFGQITDKIDAFSSGADDYLVKPFHLEELYIRMMAKIKTISLMTYKSELIKIADLEVDFSNSTVKRSEQEIKLTAKEIGRASCRERV